MSSQALGRSSGALAVAAAPEAVHPEARSWASLWGFRPVFLIGKMMHDRRAACCRTQ